jgi:two-component system, LuxR family, sensor kinase FixL
VWLIAGYLCGYVALDWVSYLYPVAPPLAITPWNPPPGLSLALLLRSGLRSAPWLFVASLGADLLVRGPHLPPLLMVVTSALPAAAYTLLVALLRGPFRFDPDFTTLRDATILVAAVAVGSGLVAVGFVGVLDLARLLPAGTFGKGVAQYWIGDLIGIVVTTPLLLVFTRARIPRLQVSPSEAGLQLGLVVATLWVVFGSGWFEELKLFYILFLPVMWIAMRHGIEGTTIATLVIQVGLIAAMRLGGYGAGAALEFQFLLLAVAITGLFLGLTVSERRAIALQLRDKQFELDRSLRLAGASEMASALAHELNQPLSAIGSYVRACQLMLGGERQAPAALKDTMDKVVVEVTRAGNVVRQLRDFFRTGSGHLAPAEVRDLLQSALDTARPRLERHHVTWRLECPPALPVVLGDRIQVETVLHNLIANAIDALTTAGNGRPEIILSAAIDDPQFVRLCVADNGPGMPSEIVAQLFRPFATSKPHGMGLGLAISRSIVEARGGRLWLQPTERGSMFCFTLPAAGANA